MKILYALCVGGPRNGKTEAHAERRWPAAGGFYVYAPSTGPTPAQWQWIEEKVK